MNEFGPREKFIAEDALLGQEPQLELNRLRAAQLQRELSDEERQRLVELQQAENQELETRKSETMRRNNAA